MRLNLLKAYTSFYDNIATQDPQQICIDTQVGVLPVCITGKPHVDAAFCKFVRASQDICLTGLDSNASNLQQIVSLVIGHQGG